MQLIVPQLRIGCWEFDIAFTDHRNYESLTFQKLWEKRKWKWRDAPQLCCNDLLENAQVNECIWSRWRISHRKCFNSIISFKSIFTCSDRFNGSQNFRSDTFRICYFRNLNRIWCTCECLFNILSSFRRRFQEMYVVSIGQLFTLAKRHLTMGKQM